MTSLNEGDYVECLEGESSTRLTARALYVVRAVEPQEYLDSCDLHGPSCTGVGVKVCGIRSAAYFCAARFRLIYHPDKSLFKVLMKPVPLHVSTVMGPQRGPSTGPSTTESV